MDAVISLARSGNSPESAAVVERVRALRPDISQFAITCNQESSLVQSGLNGLIVLDPRTNDRSLVMTGSFSNLVLGGLSLAQPELAARTVDLASERAASLLPVLDKECHRIAARVCDRIVVLSSSPLLGWVREAGLKILEMTAGHFPVVTETYLGLRHGPMSFLRADTLVLCLLSCDPVRRLYEIDLIQEHRTKHLGYTVGIAGDGDHAGLFDDVIPAVVPEAPDDMRTPFEILIPQLLGYHLSRGMGLNPDNPKSRWRNHPRGARRHHSRRPERVGKGSQVGDKKQVALRNQLSQNQVAAQPAYLFLHLFAQAGVADHRVDFRKRRDTHHAAFGELTGVDHQNDFPGNPQHSPIHHGLFQVRAAYPEVGIAPCAAKKQLVRGELLEHLLRRPSHNGCGVNA